MTIEEEHQDVLQNLESAIVMFYREHPDLIDAEVDTAIDWLIRIYHAEAEGRTVSSRPLRGISREVAESVKTICEWRRGREQLENETGEPLDLEMFQKTPDQMVACLKRIKSSIKLWTKKGGRQGYLDFVSQFIP